MKCEKCGGAGLVEKRIEYPWGGGDAVFAFCDCSVGKEEERKQYEIYFGDFPSDEADKNNGAV